MNSAQEKIESLLEHIKNGKTVVISTHTKATQITPKTLAQWEKSGHTLLKAAGNNMYMASGKSFVCIDYCNISIHA